MPPPPRSPRDPASSTPSATPGRTRVLAGTDVYGGGSRTRPPLAPPPRPTARDDDEVRYAPSVPPAPASAPLPAWARRVVIGGVLLAIGMPVSVLLSRSILVQESLSTQTGSQAALLCTAGEARPLDDSGVIGWLFGGSYFQCNQWETREARQQREREQYEANYLARQRAKQGLQ